MKLDENSIIKAISDTIANAVREDEFSLPLAAWQASDKRSDEINIQYVKEVQDYMEDPVPACDLKRSLKLLKRFERKSFGDFWGGSVSEYLPAVSEGTMKLCEMVYPHDEAVQYADELIETLSVKQLAKDFLFGVAHNAPEYRTALACYFYIKNLPKHKFLKKFVGQVPNNDGEFEDRYNETRCEICGYQHSVPVEPKMQFWHINIDMSNFYFSGRMGRSSLNTAIMYLEEYKVLPRPQHDIEDYHLFMKIIDAIENTPENTTSGKLRRELKKTGLLMMTLDQIEVFINTLGYLDILHTEDSHGMVFAHTLERDMLYPLSDRGYAEHPVNRWTSKNGVDRNTVSMLFDGIYD